MSARMEDILENKWTAVVKLKKQVIELEKQNQQLKENKMVCESCGGQGSMVIQQDKGDGLPKQPEKYTLRGHMHSVSCVQIHPVYNMGASSSHDGSIKLWNLDGGDQERSMKGHSGKVNYVCFHPNQRILASCGTDQTIKLWKLEAEFQVFKTLLGHEHEVSCV